MGWKIVRDKHRDLAARLGFSGRWRTSPGAVPALSKKLFEEAAEFAEAYNAGELYDLKDVLDELLALCDPDGTAREKHREKVAVSGLFASHLEWNPIPAEREDEY